MEAILYITGGLALLALAWLFVSVSRAVRGVQALLAELRSELHTVVTMADDIKLKVVPILSNVSSITNNVSNITANVSSITNGVQDQMVGVHQTIDDALDVIRGTLDDIERLKNDVVATVEGPVALVRSTTTGAIGAVAKVVNIIWKLVGSKKNPNMNGHTRRES